MSVLGGVGKALSAVTDKAKKAGAIKSIKAKVKVKFDPKAKPQSITARFTTMAAPAS